MSEGFDRDMQNGIYTCTNCVGYMPKFDDSENVIEELGFHPMACVGVCKSVWV